MKFRLMESIPSLAHTESLSSDDDYTDNIRPVQYQYVKSSMCSHKDNDKESTKYIEKPLAVLASDEGYKNVLVTGGVGFVGSKMKDSYNYDVHIKEGNISPHLIESTKKLHHEQGMQNQANNQESDDNEMIEIFVQPTITTDRRTSQKFKDADPCYKFKQAIVDDTDLRESECSDKYTR